MKATIKKDVERTIRRDVIDSEAHREFIRILKNLREARYAGRDEIEAAMVGYMMLVEQKLNSYLHVAMMAAINYEALKKIEKIHVKVIEKAEEEYVELNKMMDGLGFPSSGGASVL